MIMNANYISSVQGHKSSRRTVLFLSLLMMAMFSTFSVASQTRGMMRGMQGMGSRMGGGGSGGGSGGGGGSDSLSFEKRKFSDDSVNVRFRYLDTARYYVFDSSITDFFRRVPLKADLINIGHNGNATRPILFSPMRMPGWDAGFHALDPFALKISDTRFMNTTKPFTELGYLVGSKAEQQISILHTQNVMPDWNFVLEYRLVNAPGTFNSQNTNHNNIRFNSDYTSKSKRYHAYLILLSNALQTAENGGITDETLLVNQNPAYDDRFNIPTNLASAAYSSRNFFNVKLITGNRYTDKHLLLRQQYDFGIKDSVVTDSTVVRFFYPKFRVEHTVQSSGYAYHFLDVQARNAESFYKTNYGFANVPDTVDLNSNWSVLKNDFSIIQFPDSKNPLQFLKAGITLQQFSSSPDSLRDVFGNLMLHGEYRNRTRNKKWDMLLYGEFYAVGRDAGNYNVQANLQTKLGPLGSLELGFQNINRSPSYLYARKTAFPVVRTSSFNDENVTAINAGLFLNRLKARLTFSYFLQSNYTYFKNYKTVAQYAPLFNFVRAGISRETALGKRWKWYLDLHVQTKAGAAPIHLPLLYTRNRLSYEARPFRNLVIATGIDLRYVSAYFADGYSPLTGQFFYQDQRKLSPRPDITGFTHFRIRSFTAYLRLENLNTATLKYGFGFKENNLSAPNYPNPGMVFRLGIFWNFVN
jgi:hypothetical protein